MGSIFKRWILVIPLLAAACDNRGGKCTTVAECCAQFHSCGVDGSDLGLGGATGGTTGGAGGSEPAVCARYVSCSTAAVPSEASATLMAYGPSGTCWQTTPEVAADCAVACQRGIEGLHSTDGHDCPLCQTNADCGGSTPACDSNLGECVACTSNSDCSGETPICRNEKCDYGCLDSSQCDSSAPVCDPVSNSCYECLGASDCAGSSRGKACDTSTHSCGCGVFLGGCDSGMICEASGLSGGVCCTPDCGGAECGPPIGGCADGQMNYCGTCDKGGSCWMGFCQKAGQTCTPGNGDCYATEACAYDRTTHGYECAKNVIGTNCLYSSDCSFLAGNGNADWYECQIGKCQLWCMNANDCPGGAACNEFGGQPISTTWPGICAL